MIPIVGGEEDASCSDTTASSATTVNASEYRAVGDMGTWQVDTKEKRSSFDEEK